MKDDNFLNQEKQNMKNSNEHPNKLLATMGISRRLTGIIMVLVLVSTAGTFNLWPQYVKTVELDMKNFVFKGNLPFDIKFQLKLTNVDPKVKKVEGCYMVPIAGNKKGKHIYFPTKKELKEKLNKYCENMLRKGKEYRKHFKTKKKTKKNKEYIYIEKLNPCKKQGEETVFLIENVGPLQANVRYEFRFKIYKSIDKEGVKKELTPRLTAVLEPLRKETIDDAEKAKNAIKAAIKNYYDKKKFPPDKEDSVFKGFEKFFKGFYENEQKRDILAEGLKGVKTGGKKIPGNLEQVKNFFKKLIEGSNLREELLKILANPDKLDGTNKARWHKPFLKSDKLEKSVTLAEMANIFTDTLLAEDYEISNDKSIFEILKGKAKIEGNSIVTAKKLDLHSLTLLYEFIKRIKSSAFKYNEIELFKRLKFPYQHNPKLAAEIFSKLETQFEEIIKRTTDHREKFRKESEKLIKDYLENISENFSKVHIVETASVIAIERYKPYISLDFGIGYAFRIDSFFLYGGVNFYISPVNTDAPVPLLDFTGSNRLRKRISLHLGLTTKGIEDEDRKHLFSGTSLLVGLGFRVTRSIMINGGVILFRQVDENPLNDTLHKKRTAFCSLSFDINIKKLIGKFADLF